MTNDTHDPPMNVRADGYFIARTVGRCGNCGLSTSLAALGLRPGHETLDEDDDAEDEGDEVTAAVAAGGTWSVAGHDALVFHVIDLAAGVRRRLAAIIPSFRMVLSATADEMRWANHCQHCECELDDHALFCEPGGAFLPTTPSQVAAIHVVDYAEPFEANVAGYAYEPEFSRATSGG